MPHRRCAIHFFSFFIRFALFIFFTFVFVYQPSVTLPFALYCIFCSLWCNILWTNKLLSVDSCWNIFFRLSSVQHCYKSIKESLNLNWHAYPMATINDGIKYKREKKTKQKQSFSRIRIPYPQWNICLSLSLIRHKWKWKQKRVYGVGSLIYFISVINVYYGAMMISNKPFWSIIIQSEAHYSFRWSQITSKLLYSFILLFL